jgi:hypothetical protein
MAGGSFAAIVTCHHCAGKAKRIGEGIESDFYLCGECGKKFFIDWEEGEPEKPLWPPNEEEL